MDGDIAVKVDRLSKTFKLPHEKQTSIKNALISRFRGGSRSYEKQEVLKDISFDIKKGEFFGIVGRNGSGKSTLLKLLAGIYTPTSGSIQVNGKLTPFIELGVGFNPELTGRENVFLNGALLGFNRAEMTMMYADIVAFAELEKFMDQRLKNYSSGMQVRLAFSIAIRANTDILILDEVLAVGDEAFQQKCYDYFKKLKRDGKTVVLVTHDMGSVRNFCTRALLLDSGKIMESGVPEKVANEYSLRNFMQPAGKADTGRDMAAPWIKIRPISKPVLTPDQKLICKVNYYVPEATDVSFGISVIDGATDGKTSIIDDGFMLSQESAKVTSRTAGEHTHEYTLNLTGFNSRNLTVTATLFKKQGANFVPCAYTDDASSLRFLVRRPLSDNGLLKLKGTWKNVREPGRAK